MRIFKEEQRFTQPLIIVVLGMSFLVVMGLVLQEYFKENSTMKLSELLLVIGLYILFTVPIFFFKLYSRIDEKGIHYRLFPFHGKMRTIAWNEVRSAYVRKYDAISEYGGWGIKGFFRKHGKAVNVKGDIGIQLELKNSKKILIGTQKETEAKQVLENYSYKFSTEES